MSTTEEPLEAEGAKHASGRKKSNKSHTLSKSPSLQILRRLHQPVVGLNDVSISSDDGDWDSDPTVVHRRSVASSCRTSRCSSVMSTALDWEEVQMELAAISAEADGVVDDEAAAENRGEPAAAAGGDRSRSPLRRRRPSPLAADRRVDGEDVEKRNSSEKEFEPTCYFDRQRGAWVQNDEAHSTLANRIFVRNFSKSTLL